MSTDAIGGYIRKSLVRNSVDLLSPERQKETLGQLIEREHGPVAVRWYEDIEGHRSGRYEHTRPDWLRLKRDLVSGSINELWAYDQDRTNRSVKTMAELTDLCKLRNIRLVLPLSGFDSKRDGWNADTIARLNMNAVFAQHQSDKSADRMVQHTQWIKSHGVYWGTTPYGALRMGIGLKARMIQGKHAEDVRTLFSLWALPEHSYKTTAVELNRVNIRYWKSEQRDDGTRVEIPELWDEARVRQIVCNVLFYAGRLMTRGGRAKKRAVKLAGVGPLIDQYAEAYSAQKAESIDPIINDDLACQVVGKRMGRQMRGRKPDGEWVPLLTPLLEYNGMILRAQNVHYAHYYTTRKAPRISFDGDALDHEVLSNLCGVQLPPPVMYEIKRICVERTGEAERVKATATIIAMQKRIEALKDAQLEQRLAAKGGEGSYTDADKMMFEKKLNESASKLAQAERAVNAATGLDKLLASLAQFGELLTRLTPTQQKLTIYGLFERFEIDQAGKVARIFARQWAQDAFANMAYAWRQLPVELRLLPIVTPTGVRPQIGNEWLLSRFATA